MIRAWSLSVKIGLKYRLMHISKDVEDIQILFNEFKKIITDDKNLVNKELLIFAKDLSLQEFENLKHLSKNNQSCVISSKNRKKFKLIDGEKL